MSSSKHVLPEDQIEHTKVLRTNKLVQMKWSKQSDSDQYKIVFPPNFMKGVFEDGSEEPVNDISFDIANLRAVLKAIGLE